MLSFSTTTCCELSSEQGPPGRRGPLASWFTVNWNSARRDLASRE